VCFLSFNSKTNREPSLKMVEVRVIKTDRMRTNFLVKRIHICWKTWERAIQKLHQKSYSYFDNYALETCRIRQSCSWQGFFQTVSGICVNLSERTWPVGRLAWVIGDFLRHIWAIADSESIPESSKISSSKKKASVMCNINTKWKLYLEPSFRCLVWLDELWKKFDSQNSL